LKDRGAAEDFDKAIEINSRDAGAYLNRGVVRQEDGDKRGALADYEQAIKLEPQLAQAYANRGIVLMEQGRYGESIKDMEKAISLDESLKARLSGYISEMKKRRAPRR
ncbi:MAG: tetratricopeptide repeat protein, partial [Acidobacteriota bacterium]|nr:tetratricopeptide repeat protein [Acidobacteriota bacterium]